MATTEPSLSLLHTHEAHLLYRQMCTWEFFRAKTAGAWRVSDSAHLYLYFLLGAIKPCCGETLKFYFTYAEQYYR
jgi:hypothetical protein